MLGYLSYLAGELAGLSGIVTLFCCAVAISHYALHNVSAPARVTLVHPPRCPGLCWTERLSGMAPTQRLFIWVLHISAWLPGCMTSA